LEAVAWTSVSNVTTGVSNAEVAAMFLLKQETTMENNQHDRSVDMTEEALDKYAQGDERGGDDLVQQAKELDQTGPEEVLNDLDEDAARREKV
jgi:hypothetical protein